jgi:hypothetical protein
MAVKMKTGRSATLYHSPQVHYLYRRFNYHDIDQSASGAAKFALGVLPDKCLPLDTYVRVNSSCSAANIIVGTSVAGSSAAVVSTADVLAGTTGVYVVDRYYGTSVSSDTAIYIQTQATGATMGQVDVWQAFLPALPSTF